MQLRAYIAILRRFWPLLLFLPLLTGGLSAVLALSRPPTYQAVTRLLVTQASLPGAADASLADLAAGATWASSEYILDDLPAVLTSSSFAADVLPQLAAAGHSLDLAAIRAGLQVEVSHRSVTLRATAATAEAAVALVETAVTVLRQGGLRYWGRTPAGGLWVAELDPPSAAIRLDGPRTLVSEVGLRVALALAAAIGIAMFVHYLDDRLRSPQQAEEWIGVAVLAVIPKE
jgi:capsular polysaccharide biosynthesis protein